MTRGNGFSKHRVAKNVSSVISNPNSQPLHCHPICSAMPIRSMTLTCLMICPCPCSATSSALFMGLEPWKARRSNNGCYGEKDQVVKFVYQDPQATNIIINPGLAFGTGEHPTTKLCLLFLKEVIKGGEHVLDYGTGTGVLSIAALKIGAALSTGIDIDAQAVASAHENMLLNGMDSSKMRVYLVPTGAEPSSFSSSIAKSEDEKPSTNLELKSSRGTFDIVAANILLNPLLELVEDIVGYAKTGGTVAVSGILCEQVSKVEKAYSRYLDNISVSEMDGWACLQGTRKA